MYNPLNQKSLPFPGELDDVEKVTPDLIIFWARIEVLSIEIGRMESEIEELEKKKEAGELEDE
jgi:hypothetical protein